MLLLWEDEPISNEETKGLPTPRRLSNTAVLSGYGRQDPDGPHVAPINFAIWGDNVIHVTVSSPMDAGELAPFITRASPAWSAGTCH